MNYMDRYRFWCNANLPEEMKRELASLKDDDEELKGRFGGDLQFGYHSDIRFFCVDDYRKLDEVLAEIL